MELTQRDRQQRNQITTFKQTPKERADLVHYCIENNISISKLIRTAIERELINTD